jgi:hypothetical protein
LVFCACPARDSSGRRRDARWSASPVRIERQKVQTTNSDENPLVAVQGVTTRLQSGRARCVDERCAPKTCSACKRSWLRIPLPYGIVDLRKGLRLWRTTPWHGNNASAANLAQLEISTSCWKCRSGNKVIGGLQTVVEDGM